jgi:Bacterial extracellular solute-binding proteins, family 5 Middle
VRLALNYAVHRHLLCNIANHGWASPQTSMLTPGQVGYDETITPYPYDPDYAVHLLREAGYPNGFELRGLVSESSSSLYQLVRVFLEKIGVRLEATIVPRPEWLRRVRAMSSPLPRHRERRPIRRGSRPRCSVAGAPLPASPACPLPRGQRHPSAPQRDAPRQTSGRAPARPAHGPEPPAAARGIRVIVGSRCEASSAGGWRRLCGGGATPIPSQCIYRHGSPRLAHPPLLILAPPEMRAGPRGPVRTCWIFAAPSLCSM